MVVRLLAGEGQELPSRVWLFLLYICECGGETVQSSASEDIHNEFGLLDFGILCIWYHWISKNLSDQCIWIGIKVAAGLQNKDKK